MSDDSCGYVKKSDNEPCELPNCRPDGRCWHHTDAEPRANGGRPIKLDLETQETIAQAIEAGAGIGEAANKAGIHRETVGNWIEKSVEQDEGIFNDFFERFMRARGAGQRQYRKALYDIAVETKDTATLMAMLKQRYPGDWGEANRGEQTGGVIVQLGESEEFEIDPETLELVE